MIRDWDLILSLRWDLPKFSWDQDLWFQVREREREKCSRPRLFPRRYIQVHCFKATMMTKQFNSHTYSSTTAANITFLGISINSLTAMFNNKTKRRNWVGCIGRNGCGRYSLISKTQERVHLTIKKYRRIFLAKFNFEPSAQHDFTWLRRIVDICDLVYLIMRPAAFASRTA